MKLNKLNDKDMICYQSGILILTMMDQLEEIKKSFCSHYNSDGSLEQYKDDVDAIQFNLSNAEKVLDVLNDQLFTLFEAE